MSGAALSNDYVPEPRETLECKKHRERGGGVQEWNTLSRPFLFPLVIPRTSGNGSVAIYHEKKWFHRFLYHRGAVMLYC